MKNLEVKEECKTQFFANKLPKTSPPINHTKYSSGLLREDDIYLNKRLQAVERFLNALAKVK